MSFIEHQVHSRMMHKPFLGKHTARFKKTFEAHAILHHKHYTKIFSDEPVPPGEDKEIQLTVRKAPMKALPFALVISLVSWQGGLIFIGVVVMHHWIWNKIHLEMHKPENKAFSKWPAYKMLARYHFLHHRYPDKNFNVVFPFADFILGTHAKARPADIALMQEMGFLAKPAVAPAVAREPAKEYAKLK